MSNIGQQLQEARSRAGYSIKEVSDIIHVRAEYLGEIEEYTFDIPLPTVYIRGFVRLYAKFLKLDADEAVDSFNKRNQQKEFSSDVSAEGESLKSSKAKSLGKISLAETRQNGDDESIPSRGVQIFEPYRDTEENGNKPLIYVGIIALSVVLVFALIFSIKIFFFPTPETSEDDIVGAHNGNTATENSASQTEASVAGTSEILRDDLIVIAAKDLVYIYVIQTKDNEILYSGDLNAGERKTLIRDGEIAVTCDKAENIVIEKAGMPVDLQGTVGKARFMID